MDNRRKIMIHMFLQFYLIIPRFLLYHDHVLDLNSR